MLSDRLRRANPFSPVAGLQNPAIGSLPEPGGLKYNREVIRMARNRKKTIKLGIKEIDEIKRGTIACIIGNEVP